MTLQVQKLSDTATLPVRVSEWAPGYDLAASKPTTIKAGGRGTVATDLSIACPTGTYGRIAPRSGLTFTKSIQVGSGVVDADNRGPIVVFLFNMGEEDLVVNVGDRIAQLILERIIIAPVEEVPAFEAISSMKPHAGPAPKRQRISHVNPTLPPYRFKGKKEDHMMIIAKNQGRCRYCSYQYACARIHGTSLPDIAKPSRMCSYCKVHLCMVHFDEYHTKREI